ncbi:MAG: hypothetical protein ABSH09_25125 [Bryobacteraceae bacterium]|jgi:hypothetical protein
MLKFLRIAPALLFASGIVIAQDAANLFEKAPPDVDQALRARVTKFYQAFVDGKFRLADALVAEDAKDVFFAAEKKRYKACAIGNIAYSDNFTKAKAVVSCDTDYFMMGRQLAIKLPISSQWKLVDGEWFWYVTPPSEQQTYDTPFGPMKRPPEQGSGDPAAASLPVRDPAAVIAQVTNGIRVDHTSLDFNSSKSSRQEVVVKNGLPGDITLIASTGIAGLSVQPGKSMIHARGDLKLVIAFKADDPSITCPECLTHPQDRLAGDVTLRVEPTGQEIPIHIKFVVPQTSHALKQ